MNDTDLKRTPLYNSHKQLGGKLVPFAGWELPVQYSGVIPEHQAVRTACGLFDVSHMGEIFVSGPEAEKALESMTCNRVSSLQDGKAHYNAILNPNGGVVDDIIIYRMRKDKFLVCVNASNSDKDFKWFTDHNHFAAEFVNHSADYGQIALQGPKSEAVVRSLDGGGKVASLKYFEFLETSLGGIPVIAARTGYTGEDGFEFFVPAAKTEALWHALLEAGQPSGLLPCGLGARDSLRLEACYPLHGHELGDDISALESGLGWIVKFDKGDFIGREALQADKARGLARTLTGFFVEDAGISRHGDKVFADSASQNPIGMVTSGTKTPTVNRALGLALVDSKSAAVGSTLFVEVRGRRLRSTVVKKPFYKRA